MCLQGKDPLCIKAAPSGFSLQWAKQFRQDLVPFVGAICHVCAQGVNIRGHIVSMYSINKLL